ncbi:MAG: hypothetical protein AAGA95_01110 [Pseudomonadota bacterium]
MSASQARQLGYAMDGEYYGIDRFAAYVREGLADLSVEQVNAAIRRHLQTDDIHLVFIAKDAAELAERLVEETPSPLAYNTDQPEELLDEDAIFEKLQLGLDEVEVISVESVFE